MYFSLKCISSILLAISHCSYAKSLSNNVSYTKGFLQRRNDFIEEERGRQIGGNITLNAKENIVNQILMQAKRSEIDQAFSTGRPYPPSIHFFRAQKLIDESTVFKIIRKMPKGGDLHIHDMGLVNITWIVQNVTYRNIPLFFCGNKEGVLSYRYFINEDPPYNPDCKWKSVREERAKSITADVFDAMIYNSLSLKVDNPEQVYPTGKAAWAIFIKVIENTYNVISLKSVFVDYFHQGLKEFLEDNIQYIEMRANLPEIFDDNGRILSQTEVLQVYKDVADKFVDANPGFSGVKIIFAGSRTFTNEEVLRDVKTSMNFLEQFPTFFAGYDLIFDEDGYRPLIEYKNELLFPKWTNPPVNLRYFFHAGETVWQGMQADKNLIDAVLFNTTRLGHGFTLIKHPLVKVIMRRYGIAIEIQPIANQVLVLIQDQRNHPAAELIAEGFPVVIGSDTPAMWDSKPMSHDYYIAFMGFTGRDDDIKVLKKLALNTITKKDSELGLRMSFSVATLATSVVVQVVFSAMSDSEKDRALRLWDRQWNAFLDDIIKLYGRRKPYTNQM